MKKYVLDRMLSATTRLDDQKKLNISQLSLITK